ncbi:MAG: ribulose-phosphate 3-epimerase [Tetragenococcus koreensis]|nr:ribulose-phosphate 3-epimerase [Tetragenococcus koreensis]
MSEKFFCPSMMCADFTKLPKEVKDLEEAGIDIFHMDIMDGVFVPNFALGTEDFKAIRANTDKLMDVHLMISNPSQYVDLFSDLGADIIYIHPETDTHPISTLNKIKANGKKCGIAINPETSIETVKELFNVIDYLLVMTVSPGFAGQSYLEFVNDKIKEAAKYANEHSFKIVVDGAISPEKIEELSKIGVEGFVLGTSTIFNKEESYKEIVYSIQKL